MIISKKINRQEQSNQFYSVDSYMFTAADASAAQANDMSIYYVWKFSVICF